MKKRLPLIITCIALAAAIIAAGIIFNPFKSDAGKHIEMGQRYLDELQWESALAEFELALEIEPRSVEARLGAAEAYIGLGRYADAVRVLADGYVLTGDERLKAALSDERLAEALAEYLANIDDGRLAGLMSGEAVVTSAEESGDETGAVTAEPTVTATRTYPDDEVIVWQDAVFESIIREYLGKPEGDIVYADVKGIGVIRIDGEEKECTIDYADTVNFEGDIQTIADIRYFTFLGDLSLDHIRISDISPLADLTDLIYLSMFDTDVTDISPLADLTALTGLSLWDTNVSDISPLTDLTALSSLSLWDTNVSDISPLTDLTALWYLQIKGTPISDISPLANLTDLTYLNIEGNNVSDISPLANLTALETLDISLTNVTDISPLANLTNLKELYLYDTPVTDLSPLDGIEGLEILY